MGKALHGPSKVVRRGAKLDKRCARTVATSPSQANLKPTVPTCAVDFLAVSSRGVNQFLCKRSFDKTHKMCCTSTHKGEN